MLGVRAVKLLKACSLWLLYARFQDMLASYLGSSKTGESAQRYLVPDLKLAASPSVRPPSIVDAPVLVEKDDDSSEKCTVLTLKRIMRGSGFGAAGVALKPIKVKLWLSTSAVASAATAVQLSLGLNLTTFQDWGGFANVYDAVKFESGECHWSTFSYSNNTGTLPLPTCMSYDPYDGTVPSSLLQQLTYAQNSGPHMAPIVDAVQPAQAPTAVSRTGFWIFKFRAPKGAPTRTTGTTTNVMGEWAATVDAGDTFGYLKLYITAPSGTGVAGYYFYTGVNVHFRSRR